MSGDRKLLTRLVRNLMQNALRHGAPPVTAEIEKDGSSIRLARQRPRKGIPDAEQERVFEPFYRPAGHAESAGGWGWAWRSCARSPRIMARRCATKPAAGGACFVVEFPV